MRKLSKKMMISLMTFALVFIALGATTFAWFTLASTVEVTDVELNVSGGGGLNISLDGQVYEPTLSSEKIQEKLGDILMEDLTSTDGISIKDFNGTTQTFAKNKNYIELTLYFQALNVDTATLANYDGVGVFLKSYNDNANFESTDNDGTFVISKGVTHKADVAYKDADGNDVALNSETEHKAQNSLRVSFVQAYREENVDKTNVRYYDFYNKENHNYGDGYSDEPGTNGANLKGAASYYYQKHKNLINEDKRNIGAPKESISATVLNGDDFTSFESVGNDQIAEDTNTLVCILSEHDTGTGIDYRGEVTIKIWIEGWDADCFDAIFADSIKAQFAFTLAFFDENQTA